MKLRELYEAPGDGGGWAADVFGDFYKDPEQEQPAGSTAGGTTSTGSTNPDRVPTDAGGTGRAKQAMDYFIGRGLTPAQAAGIVGNLQAESGPNLRMDVVGDGGRAMGIAQWHPDRRRNFERFKGKPFAESTFRDQLDFIWWEFHNTELNAFRRLRRATSAEQAAAIIDQYYERSSGQHRQRRIANATALLTPRTATA